MKNLNCKKMEKKIEFKMFAMHCTQKQFDNIKSKLEKFQEIYFILPFKKYPILILTKQGVTNTQYGYCNNRGISIIDWNEELFLKMASQKGSIKANYTLNEYIQKYIDSDYDLPLNEGIWEFNKLHSDYLVVHKSQVK